MFSHIDYYSTVELPFESVILYDDNFTLPSGKHIYFISINYNKYKKITLSWLKSNTKLVFVGELSDNISFLKVDLYSKFPEEFIQVVKYLYDFDSFRYCRDADELKEFLDNYNNLT